MKIFKSKYNDEKINFEIYKGGFITLVFVNVFLVIDFIIKTFILNRPLTEWIDIFIIFVMSSIVLTIYLMKSGVLKTMLSESSRTNSKRILSSLIGAIFVAAMINITDGDNFYSKKGILKFCFDFIVYFITLYLPFGMMRKLLHPEK